MEDQLDIFKKIIEQHKLPEQLIDYLQEIEFGSELKNFLDKIVALLQISRDIANFDSIDNLLNSVIHIACKACDADIGSLFLYDSLTDQLYSRITEEKDVIRIDKYSGIIGAVFKSEKPLIIDDVYQDKRFYRKVDEETGYRTKSMLCVPIIATNHKTIGTLQLINKKQGTFNNIDLMLVEFVAAQASSTLQMAQLLAETERKRKLEAQILEMSTAISNELNLNSLLLKIIDLTTSILQAERCTLFLYDKKHDELWSKVAIKSEIKEIRMPKDRGIAGAVFLTRKTMNIEDVYTDPRFNQEVDKQTGYHTRSILCMPVLDKEKQAVGIIQVLNKKVGVFSKFDELRLAAVAAQAYVAIENATLFEEIVRVKNYNENILNSMTNAVITLDKEKNIVKWNPQAIKILRASENELKGSDFKEYLGIQNRYIIQLLFHVIARGDTEQLLDTEFVLANGDKKNINISVIPLLDSKKMYSGTLLVFEDITLDKRVKQMLSRYLSFEVMQELIYSPGGLKLGGELKQVTFLVSDLRGFTSLCACLDAETIVAILNRYLSYMTQVISDYGGTIDEFQGDGILAFFGAPLDFSDDTERAVNCAIAMQEAMQQFNREQQELQLPKLQMGIGIHSGESVVGNIGSEIRAKYGAVGSAINMAFRVESCTVGEQILLSESSYNLVKDSITVSGNIKANLKGFKETQNLFNLVATDKLSLSNPVDIFKLSSEPCLKTALNIQCHSGHINDNVVIEGQLTHFSGHSAVITIDGKIADKGQIYIEITDKELVSQSGDIIAEIEASCYPAQTSKIQMKLKIISIPQKLLHLLLGK